jgi:hypothetical protein
VYAGLVERQGDVRRAATIAQKVKTDQLFPQERLFLEEARGW